MSLNLWCLVGAAFLFLMFPLFCGMMTWMESEKYLAGAIAFGITALVQIVGILSFLMLMKA